MNNKISAIIINGERREASGTNLYNAVVAGRSLEAFLCRANGIEKKDSIKFHLEFNNGLLLPFEATFIPTDDGWVNLVDIIPCTEAGHLYL